MRCVASPGGVSVEAGERRLTPVEHEDPAAVLYRAFVAAVLDRVATHAVLHAAALVTPTGEGIVIAGPTGYGKSSLALALLGRGFRLLSDDYAPLDLERARVAPFPRRVAIVRPGSPTLPDRLVEAVARSESELFGKALVDVASALGDDAVSREPAPLRHVLLLGPAHLGETRVELAVRNDARDRLARTLESIEGVDWLARADGREAARWTIRCAPDGASLSALDRALSDPAVVFSEKRWDGAPVRANEAALEDVSRREAAEALAAEILNRRPGTGILERYGDDRLALFLDLAAALRHARCVRLVAAGIDETASAVADHTCPDDGDGTILNA